MAKPKLFIYCVAVLFIQILQSCLTYYPIPTPRLVDLPTPPHSNKVDMFFASEVPKDEYVKVMILEVESGINESYTNLVKSMELKAQDEGIDAVLILDKIEGNQVVGARASYIADKLALESATNDKDKKQRNELMQQRLASGDYQPSLQGYSKLHGLGIKYKKNINYLQNYLKAQHVYKGNDTIRPILSVYFDLNGVERNYIEYVNNSKQIYLNKIRKFSFEYLLQRETQEWRYFKDGYNILRKRVMFEGSDKLMSCKLQYTENLKLKGLAIKADYNNSFFNTYKMALEFPNSQVVKTSLKSNKIEIERREFNYLFNGSCKKQSIYKMYREEQVLEYIVRYEYYSNSDLDSFLQK